MATAVVGMMSVNLDIQTTGDKRPTYSFYVEDETGIGVADIAILDPINIVDGNIARWFFKNASNFTISDKHGAFPLSELRKSGLGFTVHHGGGTGKTDL